MKECISRYRVDQDTISSHYHTIKFSRIANIMLSYKKIRYCCRRYPTFAKMCSYNIRNYISDYDYMLTNNNISFKSMALQNEGKKRWLNSKDYSK